jgi:hypothetical protein
LRSRRHIVVFRAFRDTVEKGVLHRS